MVKRKHKVVKNLSVNAMVYIGIVKIVNNTMSMVNKGKLYRLFINK